MGVVASLVVRGGSQIFLPRCHRNDVDNFPSDFAEMGGALQAQHRPSQPQCSQAYAPLCEAWCRKLGLRHRSLVSSGHPEAWSLEDPDICQDVSAKLTRQIARLDDAQRSRATALSSSLPSILVSRARALKATL